jgi:hypothetical protein
MDPSSQDRPDDSEARGQLRCPTRTRERQEQVERNGKRGLIILFACDCDGRVTQAEGRLGSDSIKIVEPADGEAFTVFDRRC